MYYEKEVKKACFWSVLFNDKNLRWWTLSLGGRLLGGRL